MRTVLIRDDDVNATTPPERIERLYRPFLARGFPVNLSVIPEVRTDTRLSDGRLEGFLHGPRAGKPGTLPIGENPALVGYLRGEPGYCLAQHGLHHDFPGGRFEFDGRDAADLEARITRGLARFDEAGLDRPCAFVAPQDRMSRAAMDLVARRFPVVSGSWYDVRRVPRRWWPSYLLQKKVLRREAFRLGGALFLSHPGCRFRPDRDPEAARRQVLDHVASHDVTVVVLHHWEFFPGDREDPARVRALHALAEDLAATPGQRVVAFTDLAGHDLPGARSSRPRCERGGYCRGRQEDRPRSMSWT